MGRQKKEIKAVLCLPKSDHALRQFDKRMSDFYATQVERRLQSLPKAKKLEVIDALLASTPQ